jgi:2-methylcitrate dehydratase PrpD
MPDASITRRIAEFAVAPATPPPDALAVARLSLMDWSAVAIAGVDEPVARMARALAEEEGGAQQASAFGLAARTPARMAALVNGVVSHALDYDDTHFAYVGHPSVAVFPAALAMAERVGASGDRFLEAALIGMEAACRIGHWFGTAHYEHGFHQTATAGAFGAAVAAVRLMGLSAERSAHALGIVATRASGLKSQFGTMGKPFNAGIAASNGVEAALLAAQGFVSRPDGIECAQGFAATHAAAAEDLDASLAGLGRDYWFVTVQHKLHACCHGTHPALEAIAGLRARHAFTPPDVASVGLTVNPRWLKVCDIAAPRTGLEAKFSFRLTAAMAASGLSTARLDAFSDAICARPDLTNLRDRVSVAADASVPDTATRIRLALASGVQLDDYIDLDAPTSLDERRAKVFAKIDELLPSAAAAGVKGFDASVGSVSAGDVAALIASLALA